MLAQRYEKRLFNYAWRTLGDEEAAFDIVQESFLAAYKSLGKFKGRSSFFTWLYAIARNKTITVLRERKRHPPHVSTQHDEEMDIPDKRPNPVRSAVLNETQKRIQAAIAELDDDYREAIVLREIEGCSYLEICEITGWDMPTVKTRIHRARLQLREKLRDLL